MVGEAEVVERRVERIEEGKVLLHEGERKGHDLEETTFGEEVNTQACDERKENKGILERNLGCINFVLIESKCIKLFQIGSDLSKLD